MYQRLFHYRLYCSMYCRFLFPPLDGGRKGQQSKNTWPTRKGPSSLNLRNRVNGGNSMTGQHVWGDAGMAAGNTTTTNLLLGSAGCTSILFVHATAPCANLLFIFATPHHLFNKKSSAIAVAPPRHFLVPPRHFLVPPRHFLVPPRHIFSATASLFSATATLFSATASHFLHHRKFATLFCFYKNYHQ